MKNVFVVIENEHGETFIKVTSTEELAIKYVKEEATGICTIEKHEIDGNWIDTISKTVIKSGIKSIKTL